jgi:FAD synthase
MIQRLREQRKFEDLDALRVQIAKDCDDARALFGRMEL